MESDQQSDQDRRSITPAGERLHSPVQRHEEQENIHQRTIENLIQNLKKNRRGRLTHGKLRAMLASFSYSIQTDSETHQNFRDVLDNLEDAIIEVDRSGTILYANAVAGTLMGADGAISGNFQTYLETGFPEVLEHHLAELEQPREIPQSFESHWTLLMINGESRLPMESYIDMYRMDDNLVFILEMRQVVNHGELQSQLDQSRKDYDTLSETLNEVILRVDEGLNIVFANRSLKPLFGYLPQEIIGKSLSTLFPQEIFSRYIPDIRKLFYVDRQHRRFLGIDNSIELLGLHKDQSMSPMEISFGGTRDFEMRTLTCIIRDISLRKNAERKLHMLAYYDKLTNLGNRDLLNQEYDTFFNSEDESFVPGALLFLDLDGFKQINDTMGHRSGDELLVETGRRLMDCLRASDAVFRFGGDEFIILLHDISDRQDASAVARNILNTIRMPFNLKVHATSPVNSIHIGVSIGIRLIDSPALTIGESIQQADAAMYASKNAGKNRFSFYNQTMLDQVNEKWRIEQGLKAAIVNNELEVYYQVIVDEIGTAVGMEALLRWNHPEMGILGPDRFIDIAEDSRMMLPIGTWVAERACADVVNWNRKYGKDLYVSVNYTPSQLEQDDFITTLSNTFARTGINPKNYKIEITETSIIKSPADTVQTIRDLKQRFPDLQIMIDDFGTGYSSLNYLANLPVDILKIDLSFVANYQDENNRKIINAITSLAKSMNMSWVAEGIESEHQLEWFKSRECRLMQGYLFSRPIPAKLFQNSILERS